MRYTDWSAGRRTASTGGSARTGSSISTCDPAYQRGSGSPLARQEVSATTFRRPRRVRGRRHADNAVLDVPRAQTGERPTPATTTSRRLHVQSSGSRRKPAQARRRDAQADRLGAGHPANRRAAGDDAKYATACVVLPTSSGWKPGRKYLTVDQVSRAATAARWHGRRGCIHDGGR